MTQNRLLDRQRTSLYKLTSSKAETPGSHENWKLGHRAGPALAVPPKQNTNSQCKKHCDAKTAQENRVAKTTKVNCLAEETKSQQTGGGRAFRCLRATVAQLHLSATLTMAIIPSRTGNIKERTEPASTSDFTKELNLTKAS